MKLILLSVLVMISCSQNETTGQQGNFLNPIIAGFYPDPSICKAGDSDYYLVNSSFSYFPGIPIFHSKDLVNWQQIGNAMDRPEQMDVSGLRMSRGIFAPSIRYNKGTYYITCTLVDAGGNFIITAENPAGPWSDPVFIPEIEHIDPSLFFDDDGKVYILYNSVAPDNKPLYSGHRTIRMMEFDIEKLTVIGEEVLLINGGHDISTKPVWIEGPHIYKVNGTYFLTAGEGGTYENHSQVIFKSGQVNGPYISYEKNPILTQKHLDPLRENPITSTGHADFVEDAGGNWWAVFLGCRPYKDELYNTGRETFMAPVKWIEGWPVINPDFEEVQYSYPINTLRKENAYPLNGNFTIRDEFDSANLHYNWVFQRTVKEKWYSLTDGYLSINLRPDICNDKTNPSFIGRRQQHLTGSASVSMQFEPKKTEEKAGLSIFQNETHYYFVCKSLAANKPVVQLFKSNEAGMELLSELPLKSNKNIRLKIEANRDTYAVYYANENEEYQLLSDGLDAGFVSTKGAGGVTFVGSTYGMYATSMGVPSDTKAHYDWFEYSGNDATFIINEKAE